MTVTGTPLQALLDTAPVREPFTDPAADTAARADASAHVFPSWSALNAIDPMPLAGARRSTGLAPRRAGRNAAGQEISDASRSGSTCRSSDQTRSSPK